MTKESVISTDSVVGTHAGAEGINGATGPITEVAQMITLGDVSIAISQGI